MFDLNMSITPVDREPFSKQYYQRLATSTDIKSYRSSSLWLAVLLYYPATSDGYTLFPSPHALQLQNQSELRAPTPEKAAWFLDAAIAARHSSQRPNTTEEEHRNSHMLFTLHIYQYRMEKTGKGGSK